MTRDQIKNSSREELIKVLNENGIVFDDALTDDELRNLAIEELLDEGDDTEFFPDEYFN